MTETEKLKAQVKELTLQIAEREAVIKALKEDIKYYKARAK